MDSPLPEMDSATEERMTRPSPGGAPAPPAGASRTTLTETGSVGGIDSPANSGVGDRAAEEARRTGSTAATEAKAIATTAGEGAKQVAQSAGQQARDVVHEAGRQARNLAEEARTQLKHQAEQETDRAAANLQSLSQQARALSEGRVGEAGPLVEQIRRLADQLEDVAHRLERRGFEGVLQDMRSFARRRPAAFIGLSAIAGFAVTRIARSMGGASNGGSDGRSTGPQGRLEAVPTAGTSVPTRPSSMSVVEASPRPEPADVLLVEDETVVLEEIVAEPYEPASRRTGDGGS